MKFLADECLDDRLIMGLRPAGHDVLAVRDSSPDSRDGAVMAAGRREHQVTEDKGSATSSYGVASTRPVSCCAVRQVDVGAVLERLRAVVDEHGEPLHAMHVVVTPERVRVRGLGAARATPRNQN